MPSKLTFNLKSRNDHNLVPGPLCIRFFFFFLRRSLLFSQFGNSVSRFRERVQRPGTACSDSSA
jgi:hypothetical protein